METKTIVEKKTLLCIKVRRERFVILEKDAR